MPVQPTLTEAQLGDVVPNAKNGMKKAGSKSYRNSGSGELHPST